MADLPVFKLHLDAVATVEDDQESLFPHTPRLDDRCFESKVDETLVVECVRPGSCTLIAGSPERDFVHRRCAVLGHASNQRKELLMAHSWFQCAYACKANLTELLSSTNMRLNLGQWHLAESLYEYILKNEEVTPDQRALTERKRTEAVGRISGGAASAVRHTADEEVSELLAAPQAYAGEAEKPFPPEEEKRLLGLLRSCGHAANRAGDFEASHTWFDCCYALSGFSADLLSAANMRAKLIPTSGVALALYTHILSLKDGPNAPPQNQLEMAEAKKAALEAAREKGFDPSNNAAKTGTSRDYSAPSSSALSAVSQMSYSKVYDSNSDVPLM